jgi:hypothetical protein
MEPNELKVLMEIEKHLKELSDQFKNLNLGATAGWWTVNGKIRHRRSCGYLKWVLPEKIKKANYPMKICTQCQAKELKLTNNF